MASASTIPDSGTCRNQILAGMTTADFRFLRAHLELVEIAFGSRLEYPNKSIEYLYFLESGLASVVALVNGYHEIDVAMVGREGTTGVAVLMGSDRSPHATLMRVGGEAYRISAVTLQAGMERSSSLRRLLTRYAHSVGIQMAHTALGNGQANLKARLARSLLMAMDRVGKEIPLTHKTLARMLGVRRAGVSDALGQMALGGLIQTGRGFLVVEDREGSERLVGGLYGIPEREYLRMRGTADAQRTAATANAAPSSR